MTQGREGCRCPHTHTLILPPLVYSAVGASNPPLDANTAPRSLPIVSSPPVHHPFQPLPDPSSPPYPPKRDPSSMGDKKAYYYDFDSVRVEQARDSYPPSSDPYTHQYPPQSYSHRTKGSRDGVGHQHAFSQDSHNQHFSQDSQGYRSQDGHGGGLVRYQSDDRHYPYTTHAGPPDAYPYMTHASQLGHELTDQKYPYPDSPPDKYPGNDDEEGNGLKRKLRPRHISVSMFWPWSVRQASSTSIIRVLQLVAARTLLPFSNSCPSSSPCTCSPLLLLLSTPCATCWYLADAPASLHWWHYWNRLIPRCVRLSSELALGIVARPVNIRVPSARTVWKSS